MRDSVLKGYIENYAANHLSTPRPNLHAVFESFVAHSVLRKYHECEMEDAEHVLVGGEGDGGIDAVAIVVNGTIVRTIADFNHLTDKSRTNLVDYVFVQAKTSPTFSANDIGAFAEGVQQFFEDNPSIQFNADVESLRGLSGHISRNDLRLRRNPDLYLYYVTAGTWSMVGDPARRLDTGRDRLKKTMRFHEVFARALGTSDLKKIYREQQRLVEREIELQEATTFPAIVGVEQAYIGLLRADQFVALVSQDDDELNGSIFHHNVRHFQGANDVNEEIHQTVNKKRSSFPLFNNGITIVARSIQRTAHRFRILGPQIVNGCQTTHVLHYNWWKMQKSDRDKEESVDGETGKGGSGGGEAKELWSDFYVPIKLVATDDAEVIGDIIVANNRQTEIKKEAWESLNPFHEELEAYYLQTTFESADDKIYYERRAKQYSFSDVSDANVITLSRQTQAFVAMFLNRPHSHHQYYGTLLTENRSQIYCADEYNDDGQRTKVGHCLEPYYASGVALIAIERVANQALLLDPQLRHYKYHVLMLLRIAIAGSSVPKMNSRQMQEYASGIVDYLRDRKRAGDACGAAMKVLKGCLRQFPSRHDGAAPHRLADFTTALMRGANASAGKPYRTGRR